MTVGLPYDIVAKQLRMRQNIPALNDTSRLKKIISDQRFPALAMDRPSLLNRLSWRDSLLKEFIISGLLGNVDYFEMIFLIF